MKNLLITLSTFLLVSLTIPAGYSQTCKIRSSVSPGGCESITEAYEYDFVDQKPEFPGGRCSMINFINSTREYPQQAYENGIEGRVTCSFIVQCDGKISNIQVLRGVENSLNQEAVRVVSLMPDWTPGKIKDQAVPVRVVCCIPFRK